VVNPGRRLSQPLLVCHTTGAHLVFLEFHQLNVSVPVSAGTAFRLKHNESKGCTILSGEFRYRITPNTKLKFSSGSAIIPNKIFHLTYSLALVRTTFGSGCSVNVITVTNPAASSVTTASVKRTTGVSFTVNDTTVVMVPRELHSPVRFRMWESFLLSFYAGDILRQQSCRKAALPYYDARRYIDCAVHDFLCVPRNNGSRWIQRAIPAFIR